MSVESRDYLTCDMHDCECADVCDSHGKWPEGWYHCHLTRYTPMDIQIMLCPEHGKNLLGWVYDQADALGTLERS